MMVLPQNTRWLSKPKKFDCGLNLVGYGLARESGIARLMMINLERFKYMSWVSLKNVPSPNNNTTKGMDR